MNGDEAGRTRSDAAGTQHEEEAPQEDVPLIIRSDGGALRKEGEVQSKAEGLPVDTKLPVADVTDLPDGQDKAQSSGPPTSNATAPEVVVTGPGVHQEQARESESDVTIHTPQSSGESNPSLSDAAAGGDDRPETIENLAHRRRDEYDVDFE